MLLDIILKIVTYVVGGFINLIPDADFAYGGISTAVININKYTMGLNTVFPVGEFFAIIAFFFILETAIFGFGVFNWFIRKIPTIN